MLLFSLSIDIKKSTIKCNQNILSLIFLLSQIGFSQNTDSLWQVYKDKHLADTTRWNALCLITKKLVNIKPDSAINVANILLSESSQKKSNYYKAKAHYVLGNSAAVKNDLVLSKRYLDSAIFTFQSIKKISDLANCYITLSAIQSMSADHKNSLSTAYQALKLLEFIGDNKGLALICNNIGLTYSEIKQNHKALYFLNKALAYRESKNQHRVYTNLGIVYGNLRNNKMALNSFIKSLEISKKMKDVKSEAGCYINIGVLFKNAQQFDSAISYLNNALHLSVKSKNIRGLVTCYDNLSIIKNLTNNYHSAIKYALKTDSLINLYPDLTLMANGINYNRALAYEKLNNWELATKYYKQYYLLKDSVFNIENTKQLSDLKTNYEVEKNVSATKLQEEKKFNSLKIETEKRNATKNLILTIGFAILLILILVALVVYRNNKQKQIIKELEKNELKQRMLASQMNPHFIFNSLANIKGLIINHDDEKAITYLDDFSVLTRQILEHSRQNYIALQDELDMLKNYLSIQAFLTETSFEYNINVDNNINTENVFIPPMLIQPFVENAIKHGFKAQHTENKISVFFALNNNKLTTTIEDNGKGLKNLGTDVLKATETPHKSLAIKITQERLKHYSQLISQNILFENLINNKAEVVGFKVCFEIPYIYEN